MKTRKNLFTVLFVLLISLFLTSTATSAAPATQPEPKGPKIVQKELGKVDNDYAYELEFHDENGKVKKKMALGSENKIKPAAKEKGGVKEIMRQNKSAHVSKNGKYALVIGTEYPYGVINDAGKEEVYEYSDDEGGVDYSFHTYNVNGDKLWEKKLPKGAVMIGDNVEMADNGEAWAVRVNYSDVDTAARGVKGYGEIEIIEVYNRTGKKILSIPSKEDMKKHALFNAGRIQALSPNGVYLAVTVSEGATIASATYTRFYNLKTMKHWDSASVLDIVKISNDGMVDISSSREDIDIKPHLGE